MRGEVKYTKIRKKSFLPLIRAELTVRGIAYGEKENVTSLVNKIKSDEESRRPDGDKEHFLPLSQPSRSWIAS